MEVLHLTEPSRELVCTDDHGIVSILSICVYHMIMALFSLKQVQHEEKMLINVDNPDQVSPDSVTVSGGESVYLAQVLLNNLIT